MALIIVSKFQPDSASSDYEFMIQLVRLFLVRLHLLQRLPEPTLNVLMCQLIDIIFVFENSCCNCARELHSTSA